MKAGDVKSVYWKELVQGYSEFKSIWSSGKTTDSQSVIKGSIPLIDITSNQMYENSPLTC